MKRGILITTAIFSILVFTGCTRDPLNNLTQDESRIYITNHDSNADFSSFQTFSVADSVAVIENGQLLGYDLTPYDAALISAVKNKMVGQGYTLVTKNNDPDLGITISSITNNSTGIISYNDYAGDYYGYWDPYYWGYPGSSYYFPTYYGVYNISEGALSMDMIDLKNAETSNQLKNIWTALVRGSGIFNSANIDKHVETLFAQSAYLKK
jgi:hypothetical protein